MKTKFWFTGTLVLALGGIGCGNAPNVEEVADTTAEASAEMVRAASASARVMAEMSSLESMGSAATLLQESFRAVPLLGNTEPCTGPDCASSSMTINPVPTDPVEADAQAALLEKYLRERIFTKANVEGTEGDSTIFRITGEDACTTGSAAPEPECVQTVDKLELRIRATRAEKQGLDLGFLIGPNRDEPLVLRFAKDSVAVVVDLGEAKDTVKFLEPTASLELPRVMVGKVELRLTKNGEKDVTFSTSILDAIRMEADSEDGTRTFSTAKANPLTHMRMDAVARRLSFDLHLGTTEFSGPYGGSSPLAGKKQVVSLSGMSFAFSAEEGQEDFVIAHVGLGKAQSYVSLDGTKLFTADLNELSGRHFDLNLSRGADGLPLVRVLPEFNLVTKFFMQPLAEDPMADVPAFYENNTYRVRLTGGGSPSFRPVAANTSTGFPGGLQVLSGELTLEGDGSTVAVPTGKCLVGKEQPAGGSHPLLGHFETRDCQ